jgi:chromobox protein 1
VGADRKSPTVSAAKERFSGFLTSPRDAAQIVTDYHKRLGFDPTQEDAPGQGTKRSTSHPKSTSKRQKTDNQTVEIGSWVPQTKDWEPHVREVTHIEKNDNEGGYTVYIQWNNGKKTKVSMKQIYDHCPRPMLRFYEKHL